MSLAFFLIVPSVMIVCIVLVHALANRLGLRIYYKTLILAAVLSLAAVLATSFVTPAVGRDFLLRLGLMIAAISFVATLLNRRLLKKQRDEEERFTEEVKAAYAAEIRKKSLRAKKIHAPVDEPNIIFDEPIQDEPATQPEVSEVPEKIDEPAQIEEPSFEPIPSEKIDEPVAEPEPVVKVDEQPIEAEQVENSAASEKFPLEKVFKPLAEVKPEEADKPVKLEEKPDPAIKFPLDEVFKPLAEVKPKEADKPVEPVERERTELVPLQEVFEPLSVINLEKMEELSLEEKNLPPEPEEDFGTLDDILDRAYNERAKGHVWQAIALYRKALEHYRKDEYAPFVAIDLGNIYKEQALYAKAVKVYEDALTLPAVKRNETVRKDFRNNLVYLRVVREVLLRHRATSTPFAKLSKEILQEIDTEFHKVLNNFKD